MTTGNINHTYKKCWWVYFVSCVEIFISCIGTHLSDLMYTAVFTQWEFVRVLINTAVLMNVTIIIFVQLWRRVNMHLEFVSSLSQQKPMLTSVYICDTYVIYICLRTLLSQQDSSCILIKILHRPEHHMQGHVNTWTPGFWLIDHM